MLSFFIRYIFCIRGWGLTAQKGSSQCSLSPKSPEPRLLDQPLRPKFLHILLCFLHPLPWRAQDPAPASACCFRVGRCTGPHTHRWASLAINSSTAKYISDLVSLMTLTFSSPPENSVPPDVTSSTPQERGSRVDLPPPVRGMSRGQSRSSILDTADGTPTLK